MNRPLTLLAAMVLVGTALTSSAYAGMHDAASDGSTKRSEAYRKGQSALDRKDWDEASRIFGSIASKSSDETDAALYWKAYADWKQSLKKDALEGVRHLLSSYPDSAWADDAQALEVEIRGSKAAAKADKRAKKTPDENEELKLYALDGLMQVKPEQAVPILDRLLAGDSSLRLKKRALFVLSQSDSPRAREILLRTVRSGQPMELRCEAVRTLGIAGEPDDIAALGTISRDMSAPPEVRDCVIDAYLISGRSNELLEVAKSDPDPRLRLKAIEALGANGSLGALRQLWGIEKDPRIKAKLLESFGIAGDVETLAKCARETNDPALRRKAVEGLAISGGENASKQLRLLYGEFQTPDDRKKVLEGLMIQGDAKTLLELFRAEKDPAMKKLILQQLSVMRDPEATEAIMEVLEQ
jgi:HEAT repeat protein